MCTEKVGLSLLFMQLYNTVNRKYCNNVLIQVNNIPLYLHSE